MSQRQQPLRTGSRSLPSACLGSGECGKQEVDGTASRGAEK